MMFKVYSCYTIPRCSFNTFLKNKKKKIFFSLKKEFFYSNFFELNFIILFKSIFYEYAFTKMVPILIRRFWFHYIVLFLYRLHVE